MAKARKTKGKTAKRAAKRKGSARAGRKKAARSGRSAAAAGAGKRLAELQAENRRLRDEITSLRGELANRTGQGDEGLGERPPSLGL
jgi:hypothetical protein